MDQEDTTATTTTKFTEASPAAPVVEPATPEPVVTAPVEGAPVVDAPAHTPTPVVAHVTIAQELEADVARVFHKLRQLGIDFEVFLRGAKQRHDPQV